MAEVPNWISSTERLRRRLRAVEIVSLDRYAGGAYDRDGRPVPVALNARGERILRYLERRAARRA